MSEHNLEEKILARGKEFFAGIQGESPSLFNKSFYTGKIMDWCMQNEHFKVQLFRFVDVLPYLNTSDSLRRHVEEYFAGQEQGIPSLLRWGAQGAGFGGKLTALVLDKAIRHNIETLARQFIIGENPEQAVKTLRKLRAEHFAFTVDILGEATVGESEADAYQKGYLALLDVLCGEQKDWPALGGAGGEQDWGHAPKINVSIKPSALFSRIHPVSPAGSVEGIYKRLFPVAQKVIQAAGALCIDMEQYKYKDITLALYRRLRSAPEFRNYPHFSVVLQSYLKDTDQDLEKLLDWAKKENLPVSVRLVKGAYWDYETVTARQNGWAIPVYTRKAETDAAFERQASKILKNHEICRLACGSHNLRSISAVYETAAALKVPEERYEFQVLYGMAEPVRKGLIKTAKRVRLYAPYGNLIPGMAYLVRRLLENTANESFLRQSFAECRELDRLLEDPRDAIPARSPEEKPSPALTPFKNHPQADFTRPDVRDGLAAHIQSVRKNLEKTYPLIIGGKEVKTKDMLDSVNPANPDEVIGRVCQAGKAEIDAAVEAAQKAFPAWRDMPGPERAGYLFRAAEYARKNIYELCAWQVLEAGKQRNQAWADVAEAVDFLEYYGHEIIRLSVPRRMGRAPGEVNDYFYQPKGIAAVIAPWNFPLAISCGMSAAAVAAGNCVLYKPAGITPVIGHALARCFKAAGLPDGVFNYVPGRGRVIGDTLVEHPAVSLVAFTGSREVGARILEKTAAIKPGQENIKKVICELGGKNAVIIDDDADLDEAVTHVIASAFGYQGQKCSACSRVIVLEPVYKRFVARLTDAAHSLRIGPAEDPANDMGPVADGEARKKILEYIELGKKEGTVLFESTVPEKGFYAPLTIIEGIEPKHRLAREEIFGPVLSIMRVKNMDQALEWANSTAFALTGGIFSRSPAHLERARREFRVGNLYLNRGITGALVERQPFGGFRMSGIGSKAGGPDYLLQFMDPRTVTENTMRRGFAP